MKCVKCVSELEVLIVKMDLDKVLLIIVKLGITSFYGIAIALIAYSIVNGQFGL